MRRCLYCGRELNSNTASFCRGHNRYYRRQQLNMYYGSSQGSAEREEAGRNLRRFPGWWDYDNNHPAPFTNRRSANATATVSTPVVAPVVNQERTPIQWHFRKFGIELETSSPSREILEDAIELIRAQGVNIQNTDYTHHTTRYWKVLTDGSLSGGYCREIVSPAFTHEFDYDEVRRVAETLVMMGVKTNNSCGFHVHLDASDLTPKQIARIVKFYQVYENEIDKLHQTSRRGSRQHYCDSLERYNLDVDQIHSMNDLTNIFSTRYLKVNVQAYARHGSIEFRQHGATVDPMKIINWIKFCTRIVEYAKSENPIDASIPLKDALNLTEAEVLYWKHRKKVLAA